MVAPANPKTWRSSLFATISSAEGAGGLAGLSAEEGLQISTIQQHSTAPSASACPTSSQLQAQTEDACDTENMSALAAQQAAIPPHVSQTTPNPSLLLPVVVVAKGIEREPGTGSSPAFTNDESLIPNRKGQNCDAPPQSLSSVILAASVPATADGHTKSSEKCTNGAVPLIVGAISSDAVDALAPSPRPPPQLGKSAAVSICRGVRRDKEQNASAEGVCVKDSPRPCAVEISSASVRSALQSEPKGASSVWDLEPDEDDDIEAQEDGTAEDNKRGHGEKGAGRLQRASEGIVRPVAILAAGQRDARDEEEQERRRHANGNEERQEGRKDKRWNVAQRGWEPAKHEEGGSIGDDNVAGSSSSLASMPTVGRGQERKPFTTVLARTRLGGIEQDSPPRRHQRSQDQRQQQQQREEQPQQRQERSQGHDRRSNSAIVSTAEVPPSEKANDSAQCSRKRALFKESAESSARPRVGLRPWQGTGRHRIVSARMLMPPPPPNVVRAKMRRRRSRVCLMHSARYQRLCGLVERHSRRDDLLYALVEACGLAGRMRVVAPARATDVHLRAYHDRDYVEALRAPPSDTKTLDEFGLVDDCEVFEEMFEYCCAVVGASLHAANLLTKGEADVAINWGGGRHHAKKGEAAGFCYVNDGVLALLHMAKRFTRVLTIDIDVHHGDGLQEAFYMSDKVMTLSFHHLGKGFFPGGGHCCEAGAGRGRGYNLNVPLKQGCGDEAFVHVFTHTLSAVVEAFQPEAVVLLCGADTLSADPLGPFNLTSAGIRVCVEQVIALHIPVLMLGGGGYCPTDTARLWTTLTAAAVGTEALAVLPVSVPDHAYFPLYGPDFRLPTKRKTLEDKNDVVFLAQLCDFVTQAGRQVGSLRLGQKGINRPS